MKKNICDRCGAEIPYPEWNDSITVSPTDCTTGYIKEIFNHTSRVVELCSECHKDLRLWFLVKQPIKEDEII